MNTCTKQTMKLTVEVDLDTDNLSKFEKLGLTPQARQRFFSNRLNDAIYEILYQNDDLLAYYVRIGAE